MEVELKELLSDLHSLKKSISDPSHLALIEKVSSMVLLIIQSPNMLSLIQLDLL